MLPFYRVVTLAIAASFVVAAQARGQKAAPSAFWRAGSPVASAAGCRVVGLWELVSVSTDGKDEPLNGYRQRKMVTPTHFMWIGEDAKRDTLPLVTPTDSLRVYRVMGGSGTYTTAGDRYTERLDYFIDPSGLGKSVTATCRVDGDRWYHGFTTPWDTTATPREPTHHVAEVWRRIG
jgi:hypothetical protein